MAPDSLASAFPLALPAVWLIALPTPMSADVLAACHGLLDADDQKRAAAFRVEPAREQFVVAHAVLRTLLSRIEPTVHPLDWRFGRTRYGKPFIDGPQTRGPVPLFNLSHTDGLIAVVLSDAGEIGVDVESVGRSINLEHFTGCLSPAERAELQQLTGDARQRHFFDIWTAKEAYAKAIGLGLAAPFGAMTIEDARHARPRLRIDGEPGQPWRMHRFDVSPSHTAVVAVTGDCPVEAKVMTIDARMSGFVL